MTLEAQVRLVPSCESAAIQRTCSDETPAVTLASVLEASACLVKKIAAVAGSYGEFLAGIRRGRLGNDVGWLFRGKNLPRLLRYRNTGPADLKALGEHAEAGGLKAEQVVHGLLEWSEAVGFEDPEEGCELAEAAVAAARKAPDDVLAKAEMVLASWRRALGDPKCSGELLGSVMSQSVSANLVSELSRRYSYLLADNGEPGGAVFCAWNAVRTSGLTHERGLADLAMAYSCIRAGRPGDALLWFRLGLPLLNPVDGFPDCFQAAMNALHFSSEFGACAELSAASAIGEQLSQCSPFGAESAPGVYLKWAGQRLCLGRELSGNTLRSAKLAGGPYCTLLM